MIEIEAKQAFTFIVLSTEDNVRFFCILCLKNLWRQKERGYRDTCTCYKIKEKLEIYANILRRPACLCYLVFVLAVQLPHLAVHQVLDGVYLSLHLLLGGLQLVLQFTDERFTAAAVQRSLQHSHRFNSLCPYLLRGQMMQGLQKEIHTVEVGYCIKVTLTALWSTLNYLMYDMCSTYKLACPPFSVWIHY